MPQANRALQLLPSGRSGAWKITTSQPITSSAQNWLVKKLIFTQPLLGTSEGKLPKQPRGPQGAGQGGQQGPQSWQQGSQQEGGGQQLGAQPGRAGIAGIRLAAGVTAGVGGAGTGRRAAIRSAGVRRQQGLGEQVERSRQAGSFLTLPVPASSPAPATPGLGPGGRTVRETGIKRNPAGIRAALGADLEGKGPGLRDAPAGRSHTRQPPQKHADLGTPTCIRKPNVAADAGRQRPPLHAGARGDPRRMAMWRMISLHMNVSFTRMVPFQYMAGAPVRFTAGMPLAS